MFYHVSYFCDFMCILCVFYVCAAIGVIINDDDDHDKKDFQTVGIVNYTIIITVPVPLPIVSAQIKT